MMMMMIMIIIIIIIIIVLLYTSPDQDHISIQIGSFSSLLAPLSNKKIHAPQFLVLAVGGVLFSRLFFRRRVPRGRASFRVVIPPLLEIDPSLPPVA